MAYFLVDPSSRLDYTHNWAAFLGAGDTITARQWSITPLNGTSPETPALTNATGATVLVQGFVAGRIYHLTEHITTQAGVQDDRTITLRCDPT